MRTMLMMTSNSQATAGSTGQHSNRQRELCLKLVEKMGGADTSALGLDLASMASEEIFKWFLASLLLGRKTSEGVALKTYQELEKAGLLSPDAILVSSPPALADILNNDEQVSSNAGTAARIRAAAATLNEQYEGDLNRLHFFAQNEKDLEKRLQQLARGIRPATVRLFLMELRGIWEKAEPPLSASSLLAANNLGLTAAIDAAAGLEQLLKLWETEESGLWRFPDLEAALGRLSKNYCRKKRCSRCAVNEDCPGAHK